MIGKTLTITLTGDVLEKAEALAVDGGCSVEDAITATILGKLTESGRLQLVSDRIERILAQAAAMGHSHGPAEVSQ